MSKDDKPQAAQNGREPIPVKMLRFRSGDNVDVPGKQATQSVTATTEARPGVARWTLEYLPWMRHHRVTYQPAGGGAVEVMHVHESWCTWAPL